MMDLKCYVLRKSSNNKLQVIGNEYILLDIYKWNPIIVLLLPMRLSSTLHD